METTFRALLAEKAADGTMNQRVGERSITDLPNAEVLIRVQYSSLNYKDALSASGHKGITKEYPHTPGIDAAGVVEESRSNRFAKGDRVLVTGYDLGQNTPGGFAEYIRVPEDWIIPLPQHLSIRESMILGTAGLTAAIGVHHLIKNNVKQENGSILVTGATGGVGTLVIGILSRLNYEVVAATGKLEQRSKLQDWGASQVISREEVQDDSGRLLLGEQWSGVIDTVGGLMLDTALRQTQHLGTVTCCGNILGARLSTNIYPFILRGVHLAGIDSQNCPHVLRVELWNNLTKAWKPKNLESISHECGIKDLKNEIDVMLHGTHSGRTLVNLRKG